MKLWLLRPVKGLKDFEDPWLPYYNKAFGFVVRAETEKKARKIANKDGGLENEAGGKRWLDPKFSTCVELTPNGKSGIIIRDFANG